jgi:predicted deacylase
MSEDKFLVGDVIAEPGAKRTGFLKVPGTGVEMPMTVVHGKKPGPNVLFTGGVHGGEYPPIEAAIRLARELDPAEISGRVVIIHIVSPTAFQNRQQYLVPQDGKNINRQFPGSALGTASERMAYTIMNEVVSKVDAWVDLHGGDIHEALVPFSVYSDSAAEDVVSRSRKLAEVYGIEYVMASDSVKGGTYGASAAAGVPCILAEAGQVGQLDEESTRIHLRGCRNVLRHLGVLTGDPEPVAPIKRLQEFSWLFAGQTGCWYPSVKTGDIVQADQLIGVIKDYFGEPLGEYRASATGTVLFLVTSMAINEGDPLVGVGVE